MATNHCLLNGGDDLWEGGPSEDLALAVKGVKPIGTESVPSRFAAERQKCLWQRAHILKAKNLPALECICMAAMCTTAPAFLAQGPILWRPSGTWWNQWWNPIDVQLTTYGTSVHSTLWQPIDILSNLTGTVCQILVLLAWHCHWVCCASGNVFKPFHYTKFVDDMMWNCSVLLNN